MAYLQVKHNWQSVSMAASTTRTMAGFKAAANQVVRLLEFRATHDGATSGNPPDVTTLNRVSFATNPPGTNSTTYAGSKKDPGRGETIQTSMGTAWTVEPTVKVLDEAYNLAQSMCCAA